MQALVALQAPAPGFTTSLWFTVTALVGIATPLAAAYATTRAFTSVVLPSSPGTTDSRAPSRAALPRIWYVPIASAPCPTASRNIASAGSSNANSTSSLPCCRRRGFGLASIRFIAHQRMALQRQARQNRRHDRRDEGVGVAHVHFAEADREPAFGLVHLLVHIHVPGVDRDAAGRGEVRDFLLHIGNRRQVVGPRRRHRRPVRPFARGVGQRLHDVQRARQLDRAEGQQRQHRQHQRRLHHRLAPGSARALHRISTAAITPIANETANGAVTAPGAFTWRSGFGFSPNSPQPRASAASSPGNCASRPCRANCSTPVAAAAMNPIAIVQHHKGNPSKAPKAARSLASPPPIAPSCKSMNPSTRPAAAARNAEANPPCQACHASPRTRVGTVSQRGMRRVRRSQAAATAPTPSAANSAAGIRCYEPMILPAMVVIWVEMFVPSSVMAVKTTAAITPSMIAYSAMSWPLSSLQKRFIKAVIEVSSVTRVRAA